ncbi:DUF3068 domain-containing protein [Nocardioides stalactiti]|uniref:DUF3068 domain-containing protein n=1 Tax=Nocardioides stalactiti TaxID=2755356 RepID=UPI00160330E5|nr:DUF3068 domain-containing protein [Nocardioides stalactiti]
MRRMIGPVLVGLGVFLVVAAGLARFYAYPALARVPAGYSSETSLQADGAQVFNSDPSVLAAETHDLRITSKTSEDVDADAPDGAVVWVNVTTIDKATGGNFQKSTERVAFDAVTGEAVDCASCDTWVAEADGDVVEQVATDFQGQIYKFPFGTEKQTYDVWDGSTEETAPATYEGEEEIQGLKVYKFVQVVESQVIDTREVPGSVFGVEDAVQADMRYSMIRTFYVEPVTGSPVHRIEERTQELVYDGQAVPAFVGTVYYTDGQVDDNVEAVGSKAMLLGGLHLLYPVVMVLLGLLMLGLGLVINRRVAAPLADGAHKDRPLVTA